MVKIPPRVRTQEFEPAPRIEAAKPSRARWLPKLPPIPFLPATQGPIVRTEAGAQAQRLYALSRAEASRNPKALRALKMVGNILKGSVQKMSAAQVRARLIDKYKTFKLIDDQGRWTVPQLEAHADTLLPRDLDGAQLVAFVDQLAAPVSKNPFAMRFFETASQTRFPKLRQRVAEQGAKVLPDVLIYAQVLNRLTKVLASDYRLSEATRAHWQTFEKDPKFWSDLNPFEKVKLLSVNAGIDKYNEVHREGEVDPNTLQGILPMNIMEAVGVDLFQATVGDADAREGHRANAYAGWVLAAHGPQGEAKAQLSEDGKMVEIHPKATLAWDDLYASWNMDFVSISGEWPYYMAKLAIPEVNDYEDAPAQYINKRALALHLMMTFNALQGLEGGRERLDWSDPDVRRIWGQLNAESAKAYEALASS